MTLSIRARLTLWYSSIVVLLLATGTIVGALAQSRLALRRMDADLARTMATLEGVMRTEINEGLTLEAAAAEASVEVVAPDRTLGLMRPDGSVLAIWGVAMDRAPVVMLSAVPEVVTVQTSVGDARVLRHPVEYRGHGYAAVVVASLDEFHRQHAEMVRAMSFGVVIALLAAAIGGWLIARQTLGPLVDLADQAARIDERSPLTRLSAPRADDELGRLAASFNALLHRLASALSQQRQFMADASHELRTPVSVVRTATEVILSNDIRSADEYRESLGVIGEQANRLSRVVDEMFLLSRAEAHGVPLRREFLNLDDLLAECVRAVRVLASQRRITVATDGDDEVGLTGDDGLLRRMVGNLLDNAIRHADSGGRVIAELRHADEFALLRITNDGPAIALAERERIFERFTRSESPDGAGLGLPIARWIAEAHGGSLRLESSVPGSTTFLVTLPCDPPADSGAPGL